MLNAVDPQREKEDWATLRLRWLKRLNEIEFKQHPRWQRRGKDLIVEAACVSYDRASLEFLITYTHDKLWFTDHLEDFLERYTPVLDRAK